MAALDRVGARHSTGAGNPRQGKRNARCDRRMAYLGDHALLRLCGLDPARPEPSGLQGWTVRCTPQRRTLRMVRSSAPDLYLKIRTRVPARALLEWRILARLAELGFHVAPPAWVAWHGRISVLATLAVPGRPAQVLLAEALRADSLRSVQDFACCAVAPLVARLHAQGLVARDLYWNHFYAQRLGADATLWWIDVERVFAPRWGWRRWVVKDLAGLLASFPAARFPRGLALRFLRSYAGGRLPEGWKAFARSILGKARRIRAHQPRYGA